MRWIDAASSRSMEGGSCISSGKDCDCDPDLAPLVLLYGDSDWDWADRSEVRIDRLVGDLSWISEVRANDPAIGDPQTIVFRMGILAVEDTDTTYPVIDLFDPENLEEYQWMWLYSSTGTSNLAIADSTIVRWQNDNIHLDLRVRRSLGKKDSVLIYSQMKFLSSVNPPVGSLFQTPRLFHTLRAIIRS